MYTVFGYTDDCKDFSYDFDSFTKAVEFLFRSEKSGCVVFINRGGVPLVYVTLRSIRNSKRKKVK